ncbi:RloB family protein [Enterocloster clostridioformis]|uniref:RloB family protein n=1 Tax=Enterocloster clostridioformis TaxID=1531 RepID=UPI002676C321|nr:RloB family protein [Enterocloster clostridioformis]
MSLKPPKKSDLNKSWMKPKPDRGMKIQTEYHLIVSEGTDTESAYFEAIRDIINSRYRKKIQHEVFGEGDNTINLFWKAKQRESDSAYGFRHVWVVYDTDDFPAEHIDRVVELCKENSTEDTEYHAVWSNQCVELWYLLHFGYMQSDIHRTAYCKASEDGRHLWIPLTAGLSPRRLLKLVTLVMRGSLKQIV